MKRLIALLLVIFSVLPVLVHCDFSMISWGYDTLWLCILYIIGAYIKKYDAIFRNKAKLIFTFCAMIAIMWLSKIGIELYTKFTTGEPVSGDFYLIQYNSPTVVTCAICLFMIFARLKISSGFARVIKFFAPVSFGVYIIHMEPLISETFIANKFVGLLSLNAIEMVFAAIGAALCIWFICSIIDWLRLKIFNLIRVRKLSVQIADIVKKHMPI
ncbi:MAG: acyltransferase family protein [Bilifractor sp.]